MVFYIIRSSTSGLSVGQAARINSCHIAMRFRDSLMIIEASIAPDRFVRWLLDRAHPGDMIVTDSPDRLSRSRSVLDEFSRRGIAISIAR